MKTIQFSIDEQQIAQIVFDRNDAPINKLDGDFRQDFEAVVSQLEEKKKNIRGIVISSAKPTFFAGADLQELLAFNQERKPELVASLNNFKNSLRRLETIGIPSCAALNGSALGGGFEIALACHYRVAVDDPRMKLGLPEVKLGLLPGGGGIVRMVRLLGLEAALPLIVEGKELNPAAMLEQRLVHSLAPKQDELIAEAIALLESKESKTQVFDEKGYRIPGGKPSSSALAMKLPAAAAMLIAKTKGCYPAPEAILKAAVEGLNVDIETAMKIETGYFVRLLENPVSHNMIKTFFFGLNAVNKGASRPDGCKPFQVRKLGVLGAGMMGAGIAYAAAVRGIQTVLKDVDEEKAQAGKLYSDKILSKKVERGRLSEDEKSHCLGLIKPTGRYDDLRDCDLIIEAVFEDRELKAKVTIDAEKMLSVSGVFASNTSTLPITGLAERANDPEKFIGLHFFSPVDKMQLVEIIVGKKTTDETLAKAFDFVRQIKKIPIVVNDSRGFFTSRVFGSFANEGIAMLGEGVSPASIEKAAVSSGMPLGPLAVSDEVSLELMARINKQTALDLAAAGIDKDPHPAEKVVNTLVAQGRIGKKAGLGFYDYHAKSKHLWSGLKVQFSSTNHKIPYEDIGDRLLFIQAIETVRCLEEKVLRTVTDANIGSIFGFGFAPWSGGALQYINQFGLRNFSERAKVLSDRYGERFDPPKLLIEKAERNEIFE